MPVGGVVAPGFRYPKPKQGPYPAAIQQGGQDYDDIMARYRRILDRGPDNDQNNLRRTYDDIINRPRYTPGTLEYKRGPELTEAFGNLQEYSRTGGISEAEAGNIRARGVSPIRSVYANAQQNLNRSRALGGGYSPNFAAASTKMARDLSENLANATTNVEAGIADQRQQGRLSMAPQYAQFAARETDAMGDVNSQNEENRLRAEALHRQGQSEGVQGLMGLYGMQNDRELGALSGMQNMYSAAPGLASLYGQHNFQQQGLDQNAQAQNDNQSRSLMDFWSRMKQQGGFRLG